MNLILTVTIAALGSLIFYRMKVPAGALVGAIIFSAAFNIVTDAAEFPAILKTAVQAIAGGFIGQRIARKDLGELKEVFGAGILLFICMLTYTLIAAKLMVLTGKLDLATALVSAMPSGLSDAAIISADLGADSTQTMVMQIVRTIFCILVLPQIAYRVASQVERGSKTSTATKPAQLDNNKSSGVRTTRNAVVTVAIAECSGLLGKLSGIPAGALTFAVFAVAFQNVRTERAYLQKNLRLAAQCLTGIIVGIRVTMRDIENLRLLMQPVLILIASLLICNYICGLLLYKVCKMDISTSLFSSIPAGVSDMALIAMDMGGDAPKVGVLQLVRYVGILSVMPAIVKLVT